MLKVRIDLAKCTGYANCVEAAPDVFAMDDMDKAVVLLESPGEDRTDAVRRAARLCPVEAVVVEEFSD